VVNDGSVIHLRNSLPGSRSGKSSIVDQDDLLLVRPGDYREGYFLA
jgi:hypothetical protein